MGNLDLTLFYVTGEEVHVNDYVSLDGLEYYAHVVCVIARNEETDEHKIADWQQMGAGILFKDEHDQLFYYDETDEDITLIHRDSKAK